jgi:threonine dehydrogenase-like Zn-dependent dehydrogenase
MSHTLAATPAADRATCTARAAVLAAPRAVTLRTVPVRDPGPGEVRLQLEGCGVCGSNLPLWQGREWFVYPQPPGAPGHEGWGIVDAVGAGVSGWRVGERVASLGTHAFAEYDVVAAAALVAIPAELVAQPFPGEPLGCALNVFQRSGIEPGHTVAIIGIGFLGALLTQLCSRAGARVIAISRRPFALEVGRICGAYETLALDDHQCVIDRVRDLTDGSFCDRVIESVGMQGPIRLAGELTRERGRLVIAGFHQDGVREVDMFLWNWRGLDVVNAHERDPAAYVRGMRAAADAVRTGLLDPVPLYTHRFPLERLGAALDMMQDRPDGFLKALVEP